MQAAEGYGRAESFEQAELAPPPGKVDAWGTTYQRGRNDELLVVVMQEYTDGLEQTSFGVSERKGFAVRREFDRNPRVADYESAEEVMEFYLGE